MAYSNVPTYTVGQILTAANLNTYLRDNLAYLKGQAGAITLENYVLASVGSLGTSSGDTAIIGREQMSVSNQFRPTRWLRRFAAGTDWNNVALHDGIDIDGAFPTPGTSTRTWYERRPNNQQHLWGDQNATWMALNNGQLGIGTTGPQGRVHIRDSARDMIFVSRTFAVGVATTIYTGTVGAYAFAFGGSRAGSNTLGSPISGGCSIGNNTTIAGAVGGTPYLLLTVNSNSVSVTAGVAAYDVCFWLIIA